MHNLPLSISLIKSPFQKVKHWHRALQISIFDGKVDFYNGRFHEVVEKWCMSLANCKEIHFYSTF